MILTQALINSTIAKTKCCIAKKVVKYITLLVVGKNKQCLLKEINLLRRYLKILKSYKIVGDLTTCSCNIKGNYTFLFNNEQPENIAQLQLASNNIGTLIFNGDTYSITYYYDENNQKLAITTDIQVVTRSYFVNGTEGLNDENNIYYNGEIIFASTDLITLDEFITQFNAGNGLGFLLVKLPNNEITITLNGQPINIEMLMERGVGLSYSTTTVSDLILTFENVEFTETCNLTLSETSPFIYAEIEELNTPAAVYGGNIILFDDTNSPFNIFEYENNVTGNYPAIANLWNQEFGIPDWYLIYTDNKFVMSSPLGTTSDYKFNFYQSEGPFIPATALITDPFEYGFIPTVTPGNVLFDNLFTPFVNEVTVGTTTFADLFIPSFVTTQIDANAIIQIPTAQFPSGGTILIEDAFFNPIYQIIGNTFTSITELVDDFNAVNTYGYVAEIQGVLGPDTFVKFNAPVGTGGIYNGTNLTYNNFGAGYSDSNAYSGGRDITEGSMTVNLFNPSNEFVGALYSDETLVNYPNIGAIISAFNSSPLNQGFTCSLSGLNGLEFTPPDNPDNSYNDWKIEFIYSYSSDQYTDINTQSTIAGGIDTTAGSLTVNFYNTLNEYVGTLYGDETIVNYADISQIIANYNTSTTTQGVTIASNGSLGLEFFPPTNPNDNYNGWSIEVIYSYSSDQYTDINVINPFTGGIDRTNGNVKVDLLNVSNVYVNTLFQDETLVNYTSLLEVVNAINNSSTNLGFSCEVSGDNIIFTAPDNTGTIYNNYKIVFSYFYESEQYVDFEETSPLENGEDPQPVEYSSFFNQRSEITEFLTTVPCTPTLIEESCLTNNQVITIINYINKECKSC